MKVLVDTNVILDHALNRALHAKPAGVIFSLIEQGELTACVCATTITTIFYLAAKVENDGVAREITTDLLKLFEIAPVNRYVLDSACASKFKDFENAVIHESAVNAGAQAIITRDRKGFKHSTISVYTPKEVVRIINASH